MKIIGFNQGQIGDLIMNLVPLNVVKRLYPESHFIFSINKKYETVAPIFLNHPLINEIKIWDGYDNWPTESDRAWLDKSHPDLFFHPMPKLTDNYWFTKRHHTQEICRSHGLPEPYEHEMDVSLTRYFELPSGYENCVALTPFSSGGASRDIPYNLCEKIIDFLHKIGLNTIQLGLSSHPRLNTTYPQIGKDIFSDIRAALACKFVISADTGMSHIMGAYKHKVLGLYGHNAYPVYAPVQHRTPKNVNAIYLDGSTIDSIDESIIYKSIEGLLNE